jgi:dATP/dGTP diphosphohydrolase
LRQHVGMDQVQHGNRRNIRCFAGDARRTDRKPRFDLIPFEFLESVEKALTHAAARYGPYNWKRGQKDFFLDASNHAFVHLQKFKEGDRSEDHLAHLACNVAFMVWVVKNGIILQEDFGHSR